MKKTARLNVLIFVRHTKRNSNFRDISWEKRIRHSPVFSVANPEIFVVFGGFPSALFIYLKEHSSISFFYSCYHFLVDFTQGLPVSCFLIVSAFLDNIWNANVTGVYTFYILLYCCPSGMFAKVITCYVVMFCPSLGLGVVSIFS